MEELTQTDALVVTQKKEWGEIFTGWETRNKYAVSDTAGNELYYAAEVGGNFLVRGFLKALRPFKIQLVNTNQEPTMSIKRPFRFFFHRAEIYDGEGQLLGAIQRQWSWLRRIYSVQDTSGTEVFRLFGPILHPWTFIVQLDGREVGKIVKKWSGLAKEIFTDADNFGVTYPADLDVRAKALLLGAVFLIDFVHFEDKGNN